MTRTNFSARQEALRAIALQKLGLGTESCEYNLLRILMLAQRALHCDGARFSIIEDGQLCMIAETEGSSGCEIERSPECRAVVDTGNRYFNPDLKRFPDPALDGVRVNGAPLAAYCVMPVYSPDRQPVGIMSLMCAEPRPNEDMQANAELLNAYVRLIEDSLLLRALSVRDPLTGLYNRRYFEDQARVEWRRALRLQVPLTFTLMDVDHFKQYNDTAGHDAGDDVLVHVARTIDQACQRPGDIACRFGGEEFVLLLPMTPADGAMILVDRIRAQLEGACIAHPATGGTVTISAGIATARSSEELEAGSIDSFLRDADTALYAAKRSGRNCVRHILQNT